MTRLLAAATIAAAGLVGGAREAVAASNQRVVGTAVLNGATGHPGYPPETPGRSPTSARPLGLG